MEERESMIAEAKKLRESSKGDIDKYHQLG
jgi:hypothetical protein